MLTRPRLRVSFWYEGDAAVCELTLMTDRRQLVHRATLEIAPGSNLANVHAGLLAAASALAAAGSAAAVEASPAPATPATELSGEELIAEHARRSELREMGFHESVLRVLPEAAPRPLSADELAAERDRRAQGQASAVLELELEHDEATTETEPDPAPELSADELAAERERRAQGQASAVLEPEPPAEPLQPPSVQLTPEELDAERERRARANTVIANQEPAPESGRVKDGGENSSLP